MNNAFTVSDTNKTMKSLIAIICLTVHLQQKTPDCDRRVLNPSLFLMWNPLDHRDTNLSEMRDRWMPRLKLCLHACVCSLKHYLVCQIVLFTGVSGH